MRLVWVVLAAVTSTNRAPALNRCEKLLEIPRIVINQDEKPERLRYMQEVWGDDIIRVRGTNASDEAEMRSFFGNNLKKDESIDDGARRFFHASRGEVACTMAHIHALRKAQELDLDMALVLEDDASPHLCSAWPMPMSEIIKQVEREDPDWELIRLQWHLKPEKLEQVYRIHLDSIKQINALTPDNDLFREMAATYGSWSERSVPMTARCVEPLWGASSTIWSRRGYTNVLEYNARAPNNATCQPTCYVGNAVLGRPKNEHCFVTLPPYLGVRVVEEGSNIRDKKDHPLHHCMHRRQTFISLDWFMSLAEVFLPLGAAELPEPRLSVAHMCQR